MRPRATLKTYSHLAGARRMPSEYELVTSRLLYYMTHAPHGSFEVRTPMGEWALRHRGALVCADWERFADPRATTYTLYTGLQKTREAFVDGIFASMESRESRESGDALASLPFAWKETLARALFPMRYPWHGLQMAAAYVGQMAPSGRIAVAALFQSADEMRRIQRVAYRMALAREDAAQSKERWMRDPSFQPMREIIERLLVTYDWGEALVALNVCVNPALDDALRAFAATAKRTGDYLLAEILRSFDEDVAWQRSWTAALLTMLEGETGADGDANREAIARYRDTWMPRAEAAAAAYVASFNAEPHP